MIIHVILPSGFLLASIALVQAVSLRFALSESVLLAAWGFALGGIYLVSAAYKLVIAWGGLRGAVTLVLALGLSRNEALSESTRHFVAILATGFVLVSLMAQDAAADSTETAEAAENDGDNGNAAQRGGGP